MKKVAWWAVIAPLFAIPFLALYVDGSLFFPFITGKNFAFRMLVEIAVAGWVVLMLADKRYRPKFSWTLVLFGALTAWMAVANFFAENPHKAFWSNFERMDGYVTLIHLFLFFLVAGSVFAADKLWRPWWLTFLGAQFMVCVYALAQMFDLAKIHQSTTRLDASLGNSEYLAAYLLFGIAASIWLALDTVEKRQRLLRYALFVLAALQVVVLLGTGTRGTLVGLLAAVVFGAGLSMFLAGKKGRRVGAFVLGALVLVVGGFMAIRNTNFIQNDPIYSRFTAISLGEMKPRLLIWSSALEGIQDRPVLGWGQEGFSYVFNTYYDPAMHGQEPWFDRAHNVYLDWAIAGGIPALLLFVALLGLASLVILRAPVSRAERVLLLSALAGYAVQALVVFDNLFTYVPLAAILAMAHGYTSRPIGPLERMSELKEARIAGVAVPVVGVVLVLVIWTVNMPGITQGKHLLHAVSAGDVGARTSYFQQALATNGFATQEVREQLVQFGANVAPSPNVTTEVKTQIVGYAIEEMYKELEQAPNDARLHIQLAMLFRAAGAYPEAMKESAIARELSPRKQSIMLEQGVQALQSGDRQAAKAYFDEAYALKPDNNELAGYAAAGRIITGDLAGGEAILTERFATTTVDQTIIMLAYYQTKNWNSLIPILQKRVNETQDLSAWFQLVSAQVQAGRRAEAQQAIRDLVKVHPQAANQAANLLAQ